VKSEVAELKKLVTELRAEVDRLKAASPAQVQYVPIYIERARYEPWPWQPWSTWSVGAGATTTHDLLPSSTASGVYP
jgi:hypothetical protein